MFYISSPYLSALSLKLVSGWCRRTKWFCFILRVKHWFFFEGFRFFISPFPSMFINLTANTFRESGLTEHLDVCDMLFVHSKIEIK